MQQMKGMSPTGALVVFAAVFASGCRGDDDAEEPCAWVFHPDECRNPEDAGSSDETGMVGTTGGETGEPEEPEQHSACTAQRDGHTRTVYQCAGSLEASISFKTVLGNCPKLLGGSRFCEESHEFGMGLEPYEMPAVMACCDPDLVEEDDLLVHGASDLVEQVCASIPARIRTLIDDGALDGAKKQARSLANWIAGHPNECYAALYKRTGVPGQLEPASWLVNDGKNADWSLLNKFRIRLDFAEITGATVPADPADHIECLDTGFNKGQVFEFPERPASGLDVGRLAEVGGPVQITAVAVPGVEGGVWGGAELGPRGQCTAPWCSVVFSGVEPDGTWTLGELELYATGPSTIVAGDLSVVVERAAVRLYGESKGQRRVGDSSDTYVIAPGEAEFVISGEVGTIVGTRWASNASPLVGHRTGTEWTIDEFVIEHIQRNGEIWSVTIPQTTWK